MRKSTPFLAFVASLVAVPPLALASDPMSPEQVEWTDPPETAATETAPDTQPASLTTTAERAPPVGARIGFARASLRAPRMVMRTMGLPSDELLQLDVGLGGEFGLAEWQHGEVSSELGAYAGIFMRFDLADDVNLMGSDGIWGFTWALVAESVAFRLTLGHISGHLGDEMIVRYNASRINYVKEELVAGVSWQWLPGLHSYLESAVALRLGIERGPHRQRRLRARGGAELHLGELLRAAVPVDLACDLHSRQEVGWEPSVHLEVGYTVDGSEMLRSWRFSLSAFHGHSPLTQLHDQRERWLSFAIATAIGA